MKKHIILMPLMILIGIAAAIPSNDVYKEVKAVNEVEKGFISNNLVNEDGVILLNESNKAKIDESFDLIDLNNLRAVNYDDSFFKTIMGNKERKLVQSARADKTYYPSSDVFNNTNINECSKIEDFYHSDITNPETYQTKVSSLVNTHYSLDYYFNDWDISKEQPLEFCLSFNFSGIFSLFRYYATFDFEIPLLSIDGFDYLFASFDSESKETVLKTNNSRVYFAYPVLESSGSTYSDPVSVFVEIPFRKFIQTINVLDYREISVSSKFGSHYVFDKSPLQLINEAINNKFISPFNVSNIELNNGTISVIVGNSVYNEIINYNDSYYSVSSIVIDDSLTIFTKLINFDESTCEQSYQLYVDESLTQRFNYNLDHEFIRELKSNREKTFRITKLNYVINSYSSTSDEIIKETDFVNMGTYYAFKNITKDQIHNVSFNALVDKNSFYSRMTFSAYDNIAKINISTINALNFHYRQYGEKYSLCITGKDILEYVYGGSITNEYFHSGFDVLGYGFAAFFIAAYMDSANRFETKDELGNTFYLGGIKKTDYHFFDWDTDPVLKATPQNELFLLYTKADIVFDSLISCVYVDKKGDIINASETLPDGTVAPTAVINGDGTVDVIDINGEKIGGTVDDKGFFIDENGNRRPDPDNVPELKDNKELFHKIAKIACAVVGFVAIVWTISKVGPTVVALINGRRKNE